MPGRNRIAFFFILMIGTLALGLQSVSAARFDQLVRPVTLLDQPATTSRVASWQRTNASGCDPCSNPRLNRFTRLW